MPDHNADQRERNRRQNDKRQLEAAELRHDKDIDAYDRHHECRAHVAEGDVGDLPLAIPQDYRLTFVLRLAVKTDGRCAERAPIMRLNALVDVENAVDRG